MCREGGIQSFTSKCDMLILNILNKPVDNSYLEHPVTYVAGSVGGGWVPRGRYALLLASRRQRRRIRIATYTTRSKVPVVVDNKF